MCSVSRGGRKMEQGPSTAFTSATLKCVVQFGGRLPWDATAICSGDDFGGKGATKRGDFYAAAPNIDHSNSNIRNDLINWMKFLRSSIGFDGWRFDFVKGYPGDVLKEYIDSTVPELSVGEFWDTCEYTNSVLNYNQVELHSLSSLSSMRYGCLAKSSSTHHQLDRFDRWYIGSFRFHDERNPARSRRTP